MKGYKSVFYQLISFLGFIVLPCILSAQEIPAYFPQEILKQRQESFRLIQALDDPFEDTIWYHGRIYEFELKSRTGTPYFFNATTLSGSLTYNGKWYEDLILSYNLIMDDLIVWKKGNTGNMMQIVLNKYYVERFTLNHYDKNYHFRLNTNMKPIHDKLEEGFYEVVYDNELSMFVKHKKELSFDTGSANPSSYQYAKQVYLILDGKIYMVDSRRDYLKAFQDKKSLRKYMRQEKINFEKSGTQILAGLCVFSKSLLDH